MRSGRGKGGGLWLYSKRNVPVREMRREGVERRVFSSVYSAGMESCSQRDWPK